MSIKSALWICSGLLFCACVPPSRYNSEPDPVYFPALKLYGNVKPKCSEKCDKIGFQCATELSKKEEACKREGRIEQALCKAQRSCYWNPIINDKECDEPYCPERDCSLDAELMMCLIVKAACWKDCGGTVKFKQKCIRHCPISELMKEDD